MIETIVGIIYSIGTFFVIYALLALSLNIELGYGGLSNFGKVAFYAIGAFATGALADRIAFWMIGRVFDITSSYDPSKADVFKLAEVNSMIIYISSTMPFVAIASFIVSMLVAVGIAGLFGLLATYPTLRLKIDYLGITLLVFGEIVRIIGVSYEPMVAGPHSMAVIKPFAWLSTLGMPSYMPDLVYFLFTLAIFVTVYLMLEKMLNSPFGRALKAMRDDELAAASLGKNLVKLKAEAMVLGSMIAGLAGALYVGYTGSISASEYIPFVTFIIWTIVLLGGSGNNVGVIVGAVIWMILDRTLRVVKDLFPTLLFSEDYLRYLLTGVFIVLLVTYRPYGILPEKEIKTPSWKYLERVVVSSSTPSGGGGEE
ncbi:MAG: branched-chain amino acid ABC transporter permease [Sulfolobales archaeon]